MRLTIYREDRWAPCIWIGDRAFNFGRSTAATDPWPFFFSTFGLEEGTWQFQFPWWQAKTVTVSILDIEGEDVCLRIGTRYGAQTVWLEGVNDKVTVIP